MIHDLTDSDRAATAAALIPLQWAWPTDGAFAGVAWRDPSDGLALAKCREDDCDTIIKFAVRANPNAENTIALDEASEGADVNLHYIMCSKCVTAERDAEADYYDKQLRLL